MSKKKKKAKPKIEQVNTEPELSETPVIGGEQAGIQPKTEQPNTEPKIEVKEEKPPVEAKRPESKPAETRPPAMPRSIEEMPTIPRPEVEPKPEPIEPGYPVTCSGCKMIVDSSTVMPCLNPDCKGSLVFCPDCAKAKTCHKCGKKLDPNED